MSITTVPATDVVASETGASAVDSTDGQDPSSGSDAADSGTSNEDELPDWARKELTKVRGEAANWRTQLRDAQAALNAATTPEEFAAATTALQDKVDSLESSIARGNVARKYGLPDALAARLNGATEEELEADAQALKALMPTAVTSTPESLSGGLDPSIDPDPDSDLNPGELARKYRKRY